jgi:hypothetical protein
MRTPNWRRGSTTPITTPTQQSERGVHSSGGSVTHVGEYVRVDVKSEANVSVAQKLLDVLGVHTLLEKERRARVAEVVKADVGQICALEEGLERAIEVAAG